MPKNKLYIINIPEQSKTMIVCDGLVQLKEKYIKLVREFWIGGKGSLEEIISAINNVRSFKKLLDVHTNVIWEECNLIIQLIEIDFGIWTKAPKQEEMCHDCDRFLIYCNCKCL